MKVAYHFKCTEITERYDALFYKKLFTTLLRLNEPFISSKILIGDLIVPNNIRGVGEKIHFLQMLFVGENWNRIIPEQFQYFVEQDVFIICFETIQKEIAEKLHDALVEEQHYLGALEIDNSLEIQWWTYGEYIGPKFRILDKKINVLIDSDSIEDLDVVEDHKEYFKGIPFEKVGMEISNYRYSIMDDHHHFENAKRVAEWRKGTESLFSTITDEIISKLADAAPELTDKLWTINHTFQTARTGEQYALAMTACRRLFEYIADSLFPARSEIIDGHSLKKDKYKNRLFEFAKRELSSDTNIDFIVTNTSSLFEEWNKLYELSNKGVHSDPHRQECRRCIIRTILLLDDLISIKRTPFEVKVKANKFFEGFMEDRDPDH